MLFLNSYLERKENGGLLYFKRVQSPKCTSSLYTSAYRFTLSNRLNALHCISFSFCWCQNCTPFNLIVNNLESCSDFELSGHTDSIYF